jgi:hypothetical protein
MAEQWFVIRGQKNLGPFTAAKLRELAAKGKLHQDDMVRRDDMRFASPAGEIDGIFPTPQVPARNVVKSTASTAVPVIAVAVPNSPPQLRPTPKRRPLRRLLTRPVILSLLAILGCALLYAGARFLSKTGAAQNPILAKVLPDPDKAAVEEWLRMNLNDPDWSVVRWWRAKEIIQFKNPAIERKNNEIVAMERNIQELEDSIRSEPQRIDQFRKEFKQIEEAIKSEPARFEQVQEKQRQQRYVSNREFRLPEKVQQQKRGLEQQLTMERRAIGRHKIILPQEINDPTPLGGLIPLPIQVAKDRDLRHLRDLLDDLQDGLEPFVEDLKDQIADKRIEIAAARKEIEDLNAKPAVRFCRLRYRSKTVFGGLALWDEMFVIQEDGTVRQCTDSEQGENQKYFPE